MTTGHEVSTEYPTPFLKVVERLMAYASLFGIPLKVRRTPDFSDDRSFVEKTVLRFCDGGEEEALKNVFVVEVPVRLLEDENAIAEIERAVKYVIETGRWPQKIFKLGVLREVSP